MVLYHDHLMRAFPTALNPELGLPIWGDKYRTPFARMRVSVNVERGLGQLDGGMWFQGRWKVVVLLGGWVGGRVAWGPVSDGKDEGGEEYRYEEGEQGDVWVLGGEALFGNEAFVGQRIQVEFFVPEVGYLGEDDERGDVGQGE